LTWNSTPVTRLQYFENEVVQRVRSECPELRESNTQCYIIENDEENFFIRDNVLYGVFDEIYSLEGMEQVIGGYFMFRHLLSSELKRKRIELLLFTN
jgi:hypothetical protein